MRKTTIAAAIYLLYCSIPYAAYFNGPAGMSSDSTSLAPYASAYSGTHTQPTYTTTAHAIKLDILKSYSASCKSYTCNICIHSSGSYTISGYAYFHTEIWRGAQFYIAGNLVDTNNYYGDRAGTGFETLTGKTTVNGPGCFNAYFNYGGSAWGDYTINLLAVPQ